MEFILDRLVAAGWVAKLQGNGWILARDADGILVIDVFRSFVIRAEAAMSTDEQPIRDLVAHIVKDSDDIINMTLAQIAYLGPIRGNVSKVA